MASTSRFPISGGPARHGKARKTATTKTPAVSAKPSKGRRNNAAKLAVSWVQPRELSGLAVPQQRAYFLIQALGSQTRVATLLEVSRSQPGRWSKGEESPSPDRARELIDLDHVVARVVSWLGPDMTMEWLNGSNAFLEGSRPIDVLRTRGSSEVVDALDAEMSGAFA